MRNSLVRMLLGMFILGTTIGAALAQDTSPPATAQKPQGLRIMQLVLFKLGPTWAKDKPIAQQPGIRDHGAYMGKLLKEGTLVLGGPLLEDPKNMSVNGAAMILAADSVEAARQILDADPAHTSGLLEIIEIRSLLLTAASWRPQQTQ